MPKNTCPNCHKVIEELRSYATVTTNVLMTEDGEVVIDNEGDNIFETYEWKCPECQEVIAMNEYDAKMFLTEKDELKEVLKR